MKRPTVIFLALAAALPLSVGALTIDTAPAAPQTTPPVAAPDTTPKLTAPAQEVLKMAAAGVPDEVIKAYVETSSSTFNLTPDGIISLQGAGVSSAVTSTMLAHDKVIIDRATVFNPPPVQVPQPQQPAPAVSPDNQQSSVQVTTIPYNPGYSDLAPYGGWYSDPTYGSYWAPYPWVSWSSYPWGFGWFGGGRWWCHPTRGWCWSPGVRVGVGVGFGGFRGGFGFGRSFVSRGGGFHSFGGGFGGHGSFGGHGGHR